MFESIVIMALLFAPEIALVIAIAVNTIKSNNK